VQSVSTSLPTEMFPLLLISLVGSCLGVYVPGTPGADWTIEELVVVKAKLFSTFRYGESGPQALRLGFHDCLKYMDGTGGCDGCLNWHNVGNRTPRTGWVQCVDQNVNITDNNGLSAIVEKLERIYTSTNQPWNSPTLRQSLRDSGKSRADLWAYASMVAVEYGTLRSNMACQGRLGGRNCVHDPHQDCMVQPTRPFTFESGRADCTEHNSEYTYQATREEHHPSPNDNGRTTIEFMKNEFDFTGRETAAIFGAHSYGRPRNAVSGFPYTWTSSATTLMNNDYYKSMVGQNRWFFDDDKCNAVGDAFGRKPLTRWLAHARGRTENGGPVFWIKENLVCPNRAKYNEQSDYNKACLDEAEPGMTCRADPTSGGSGPRTANQTDGNVDRGCERYRFISGRDEIAMNCEIGLYLDFNVEENGSPSGCAGLEHFAAAMGDPCQIVWSKEPGTNRKGEPGCSRQGYAEPTGSQPVSEFMELYANNQTAWINDYILAHEKMVRNGYPNGLNTHPENTEILCPLPTGHNHAYCYLNSPGEGPIFMIGSRHTNHAGKVVEPNPDLGVLQMRPNTGAMTQQWQWSASGNQLINVATGLPLAVRGQTLWVPEMTGTSDWIIKNAVDPRKAIDVYGSDLGIYWSHRNPWQVFYPIIAA
jgi:hypothetical protein